MDQWILSQDHQSQPTGKTIVIHDFIHVIVDRLTKMVHYELVKVTIDDAELAEVYIDVMMQYDDLPDFIISNRRAIFTSKFWFLLCYFLDIQKQLSTAFYT